EWKRLGEAREALWNARLLLRLESLEGQPAVLDPSNLSAAAGGSAETVSLTERFLQASRDTAAQARRVRWIVALSVPAALLLAVGVGALLFWLRDQRAISTLVEAQLARSSERFAEARALEQRAKRARSEALALFDQNQG